MRSTSSGKTGDICEVEEKGWEKKEALTKNHFLRKNHALAQQLLAQRRGKRKKKKR